MKLKGIVMEDFINYKKPSMFILFPNCNLKCEKEAGVRCCQNSELFQSSAIEVGIKTIVNKYINNPITKAIVFGGLEPFDSFEDLFLCVTYLRVSTNDDIVIYTGYNKSEIQDKIDQLKQFPNIICKFGRFIPRQEKHYDEVLGVSLASDNQYAERIS